MRFTKNKIKGITFHHKSQKRSIKSDYKLDQFFNLDDLYLQIKNDTPTKLTNYDIKRLLADLGRNEINSQISSCIDFSTKWNGILKVIERCFPNKYFLSSEYICMEDNFEIADELEIYLAIKRLIALWRHNLNILEMTAQAQYSIPFEKYLNNRPTLN
jgi:hypothetical protein